MSEEQVVNAILYPELVAPAQAATASKPAPTREEQIETVKKTIVETKDDAILGEIWKYAVDQSHIMYRNKRMPILDMLRFIEPKLDIPQDMTLPLLRQMETNVGNLLHSVSTELTLADYVAKIASERKKDYLSKLQKSKSRDFAEAQLVATDEEYKMVRGAWLSADLNLRFWEHMKDMCLETLRRLSNIYNTIAAETRINNYK